MFGNGKFPEITIGNIIKTTSGGTPSKNKPEYYQNGMIPWLTSGEVNQGIILRTKNFISELGLKNSSAKWVPAMSVVIAMYGATAGKVGLLKIPTTTNQAVCSLLPTKDFIPEYLYFAVSQKEDWMVANAAGGAQPNISQNIIKKMQIIHPPLALQNEFAAFIEQLDKSKVIAEKWKNVFAFLQHSTYIRL